MKTRRICRFLKRDKTIDFENVTTDQFPKWDETCRCWSGLKPAILKTEQKRRFWMRDLHAEGQNHQFWKSGTGANFGNRTTDQYRKWDNTGDCSTTKKPPVLKTEQFRHFLKQNKNTSFDAAMKPPISETEQNHYFWERNKKRTVKTGQLADFKKLPKRHLLKRVKSANFENETQKSTWKNILIPSFGSLCRGKSSWKERLFDVLGVIVDG